MIGLFTFSVSSWLSLGRLCLYEHLSVSSRFFRFICIQWFAVAAYGPLYFSPLWLLWGICCDVWASLVVMCRLYSVRARELQCLGSLVVTHGILAPPALGAWSLIHCTTRQALSFVFLWCPCVTSPFSFLIIPIWVSPPLLLFFLVSLAKGLSLQFIFSRISF